MEPMEGHGIQAMSVGFLIEADTPMVWRGPMVTQALEQLLTETKWRDLDYLVVDLPPGTGDIQLTLAQKVPVTGAVIVTTPQDIALIDARKGLKMFEKVGIPILGIVENMAIHVCSNCGHAEHIFGSGGGEKMCKDYDVEFLGSLPLDIRIREQADSGKPTVVADPDGPIAISTATSPARWPRASPRRARTAPPSSPRSSSRTPEGDRDREHQERQVDPPHGGGARHDRALRAGPGARGRRQAHRLLRHLELRLRHPRFVRIQDLHQHQLHHRRPEGVRSQVVRRFQGDVCIIPPNSFALARTVEYFRIPRNVLTVCLGKSTYARCGIIVNVTPFEPEWEGFVTLEFSNTTPLPGKIYANEGVAQVIFFESDEVCETSYRDRGGKYQGQQGVTLPKM